MKHDVKTASNREEGDAKQGARARPERSTPKSIETRARIVRGALRALELHGLHSTTTRRIASEAGVPLAALHYHFKDKEALLLAVFKDILDEMTENLSQCGQDATSLPAQIAYTMNAAWDYVLATRTKQIVQYELTLYALRMADSAWLASSQYQAYVDLYAALLSRAEANSSNLDTIKRLTRMVLASMDGLILQYLAGGEPTLLRSSLNESIAAIQARAEDLKRCSRHSLGALDVRNGSLERIHDDVGMFLSQDKRR